MTEFLELCQQAARIGGARLTDWQSRFRATEKSVNDFVTDADFASQQAIHDFLHQHVPDHGFAGEEDLSLSMSENRDSPYRWIVDPLDGTLNYVHQLPSWSVSIALQQGDRMIAGAVYDPWLDELYSAARNEPATLNGKTIQPRDCTRLSQALLVVSLPPNVTDTSPELNDLVQLLCATRSVRRLGSAALNLCYVAAGRIDAYWASSLKLWDIAAGWLILEQAGGCLLDPEGNPLDPQRPRLVAAATGPLARQVISVLQVPPAEPPA